MSTKRLKISKKKLQLFKLWSSDLFDLQELGRLNKKNRRMQNPKNKEMVQNNSRATTEKVKKYI